MGILTFKERARVVRIAPDRGQRLVQLMAQTRRHLTERRQFGRLHQLVLRMPQLGLRALTLGDFAAQLGVSG